MSGQIIKDEDRPSARFPHYFHPAPFDVIDVYRVLEVFGVTSPALQHAIKKLLVAGSRGSKDEVRDIQEARTSLDRWLEMRLEDVEARRAQVLQEMEKNPPTSWAEVTRCIVAAGHQENMREWAGVVNWFMRLDEGAQKDIHTILQMLMKGEAPVADEEPSAECQDEVEEPGVCPDVLSHGKGGWGTGECEEEDLQEDPEPVQEAPEQKTSTEGF